MHRVTLSDHGQASRARAETAMRERPLFDLEALIDKLPPARKLAARLAKNAGPHPRVLAGMQRSTPGGPTREPYRPRQIAMGYARVGAAALAVMTEPAQFGGELDHISEARPAFLPILRNDFLVTPYQIAQSRVAGADAVLLIAELLGGAALGVMMNAAHRYGVEALVETHDGPTLKMAFDAGATMIAVGGSVAIRTVPEGALLIATEGIDGTADIERLTAAGFDAVFISDPLMRAPDPADALWALMHPSQA